MHAVLFIVEKPFPSSPKTHQDGWFALLGNQGILKAFSESNPEVKTLNEGTYWLALSSGLDIFVRLASECVDHHVPYFALHFEEEPNWISSQITASKTTSGKA